MVAGEGVSFCFGGLPGLSGLGFAGFGCWGGTAGVARAAGFGAGGLAGCAGTAGVARAFEWCVFFALACRPRGAVPRPFELVEAGGADAAEACAVSVDGPPDGVLLPPAPPPPPGLGWPGEPAPGAPGAGEPGTGEPGAGAPGAGEPGTGEPGAGEPGAGEPGTGTEIPPPGETNTWVKPVNGDGDGDTVGFALPGLAGWTSAGTLRSCVPGRASSRIAERSSTERACIQSCADATAPAVTAAT